MSDKPRRWFQVHLSTAVVMMFVAGGLLWLSTRNRAPDPWYYWDQYGWPWIAFRIGPLNRQEWLTKELRADLGVALLSLIGTAVVLEWRIRRREARKP